MLEGNHPNAPYLTVADPKQSIRFYKKLGFELENCWPDARKPEYASLVLDRQVVMVGTPLTGKDAKDRGASKAELRRIKKDYKAFMKHRHGVGVHLYLRVPDPDAHHRNALRRKVEVLSSPTTHFYGIRSYVAADPDGYQLVFFAPAESAVAITPAPARKARAKARRESVSEATAEPVASVAPQ
jgi:uncharacterized glyoxalase superfamily protein PhnB